MPCGVFKEALIDAEIDGQVHVGSDGGEAMALLRREPPFADAPRLDLVLLDLLLSGRDGRNTLREIRDDPKLCEIPVMLALPPPPRSVAASALSGPTGCFIKPRDFDEYRAAVETIRTFWQWVRERSSP